MKKTIISGILAISLMTLTGIAASASNLPYYQNTTVNGIALKYCTGADKYSDQYGNKYAWADIHEVGNVNQVYGKVSSTSGYYKEDIGYVWASPSENEWGGIVLMPGAYNSSAITQAKAYSNSGWSTIASR